jgi:hypothetical protein
VIVLLPHPSVERSPDTHTPVLSSLYCVQVFSSFSEGLTSAQRLHSHLTSYHKCILCFAAAPAARLLPPLTAVVCCSVLVLSIREQLFPDAAHGLIPVPSPFGPDFEACTEQHTAAFFLPSTMRCARHSFNRASSHVWCGVVWCGD